MIKNFKEYLSTHGRSLWISAGLFLLLVVVAIGPSVYHALADLSSLQSQAIQLKNVAITEAIVNNDYDTWESLVDDDSLKNEITAENFATFSQAYTLLEQGEIEAANILKKQANLKKTYQVVVNRSSQINDAIENGNYYVWRSVVGADYSPEVDYYNFRKYSEAVSKANSGSLNKASKLKLDLGLKQVIDYYSSSH